MSVFESDSFLLATRLQTPSCILVYLDTICAKEIGRAGICFAVLSNNFQLTTNDTNSHLLTLKDKAWRGNVYLSTSFLKNKNLICCGYDAHYTGSILTFHSFRCVQVSVWNDRRILARSY